MALERRHALWPLIVGGHVGLLAGLAPRLPAPPEPTGQRVTVKLLPSPPRTARREIGPRAPFPATPARQAAPAPARTESPATLSPPDAPPDPAPDTAEAAPAPPHASLLMNSEATRQAVRLAARAPLLSERAASASHAPARENAQERFGREVARTAYGNCLKGEFPGGGMELLSLPFWLAAEASGKCRK